MSFQCMAWAVDLDLPTHKKMVLLMLANRTNHDTGRCDPSIRRLAKDCGMSERSVQNKITELINDGLLKVHPRHNGVAWISSQYELITIRTSVDK